MIVGIEVFQITKIANLDNIHFIQVAINGTKRKNYISKNACNILGVLERKNWSLSGNNVI